MTDSFKEQLAEHNRQRRKVWLMAGAVVVFFAVQGLMVTLGVEPPDDKGSLLAFIVSLPTAFIQFLCYWTMTMGFFWITQAVRAQDWFDQNSSAQEMKVIQDRIMNGGEKMGDNQAVGKQNMGNSILIGLFMLCFFLGHLL